MLNVECISLLDKSTVTPPASAVLCLGNFDGMHLAHQKLIQRAKHACESRFKDAACGVFCFREPSWRFLSSNSGQKQLSTLDQKLEAMRLAGAEYAYLVDFPMIAHLSPIDFLQTVLVDLCHAVGTVCGFNYRFGAKGVGTANDLRCFFGENAIVEEEIQKNGQTVSSTNVRLLLTAGKPDEAASLLGKPYALTATVVHGKSLGKKLGAPTVNQYFPADILIPRHGVYATRCIIDRVAYRGVSNVGSRPTVDENERVNCETYLIGFQGDLYDRELTVEFLYFLRPEKRFSSQEALTKQIQADIKNACDWHEKEALV